MQIYENDKSIQGFLKKVTMYSRLSQAEYFPKIHILRSFSQRKDLLQKLYGSKLTLDQELVVKITRKEIIVCFSGTFQTGKFLVTP